MADDKENKEKIAFDELKKRMHGEMDDEMYKEDTVFYRFLRARDFKVDNAEQMLRQHLEWRKKYDVKNISKYKPPEVIENHFILTFLGHDKEGRILKYIHFSNTDFRGIFESCKCEDWCKSLIHFFENDIQELKRQTVKLGKLVDKVIYIANTENFSLGKATDKKVIKNVSAAINMYLYNYPETLKTIYITNAPVYFKLFYSLMKPFLPSTVHQKIKIYSDDSWKKEVQEIVDLEILPAFLGGKRTDPDGNPLCLTLIKNSELVPKRYYMQINKQAFTSLPDVEKVIVSKASVHEICIEIKEPDSHLEWEFQLKSGDIKFGIFYEDYKGKRNEKVPMQRLNTDENTESGLYMCEDTGKYIVVFDNTFSLLRSKEIYCKIKASIACEEFSLSN